MRVVGRRWLKRYDALMRSLINSLIIGGAPSNYIVLLVITLSPLDDHLEAGSSIVSVQYQNQTGNIA